MPKTALFLALTREEARRLFGLRGDEAVRSFVSELASSEAVEQEERKFVCSPAWKVLHDELSRAGYPLDQTLRGGREMAPETVLLKRPDVVVHITEALNKSPDVALHLPPGMHEFYRRAAEQKYAVLFVMQG